MLIRPIFPNHFVPALQVIRSNYVSCDSWLFIEGLTYKQPFVLNTWLKNKRQRKVMEHEFVMQLSLFLHIKHRGAVSYEFLSPVKQDLLNAPLSLSLSLSLSPSLTFCKLIYGLIKGQASRYEATQITSPYQMAEKWHAIIENLEVDQYLEAQGYMKYDNTMNTEYDVLLLANKHMLFVGECVLTKMLSVYALCETDAAERSNVLDHPTCEPTATCAEWPLANSVDQVWRP